MTFNFDTKTKKKITENILRIVKMSIKDRKKLLFFAGIIMILLPVAYLTLRKPSTVEASWWTGGGGEWQKRKHLTITNDSSDDLAANTTVAVSLNTKGLADGGKVRSDCNDIRIVYQPNSTTQTELDRYLSYPDGQTCETSGATKIYFSLQAALNDGANSENYYVYFDNNEASSPSTQVDAFDIGSKNALLACPFDGTTACINGDGTEDPTTESGAVRYGGGKGALAFDGRDDYMNMGSDSSLDDLPLGDLTVEVWMYIPKTRMDSTTFRLLDKTGNPDGWKIDIKRGTGEADDGQITVIMEFGDEDLLVRTGGSSYDYDEWTHFSYTYDGSLKRVRIFLNGTEASYGAQTDGSGDYVSDASRDLGFGSQSAGGSLRFFAGYIDEMRISNTVRYSSNFTPQTTPFVRDDYTKLLYHFDESGDDPRESGKVIDDSGNGNHGTVYDAKYVEGIVGRDNTNYDEGQVDGGNAYAGHEGIFIEEATTNKITNPSFEHSAFDTSWTDGTGMSSSENTTIPFYKFGSKSAKLSAAHTRFEYTTELGYSTIGLYDTEPQKRLSQGFKLPTDASPTTVSLDVGELGTASDYSRVEIQTDSSGVPSNSIVSSGSSDCIAHSSLSHMSVNMPLTDFTFPTPPSLSADTQYHIVIKVFTDSACTTERSSPSSNRLVWRYCNSGTYPDGDRAIANESDTWTSQTDDDHVFAISDDSETFLTSIDLGSTADYTLSAYAYNGTSNDETMDSTHVVLVFDGTAQTTTYTDMGDGWWRLSFNGTGIDGSTDYGVEIPAGKIIYVDGVQLEENTETSTYADGSLGTSYSWSGTENDSTSTRSQVDLQYSNTSNIDKAAGSISMWVKYPKDTGDLTDNENTYIFDSGYAGDGSYRLFYNSDTDEFWFEKWASSTGYYIAVAKTFSANEWVHLVATWDTSSGTALYVNAGTPDTDANTTEPSSLESNMYIGDSSAGSQDSNLTMSDLRIWDDSLTAAEITDLYYSGLVAHSQEYEVDVFSGDKGQDPVAIWHFDEGYGSMANDSSSYGNDLTVSGASWDVSSAGGRAKLARNLSFDGSIDYLSRYTDKDFNFSDDSFTISGWVRHPADSDGTQDTILARYDDAGYKVYMAGSGYLCFGIDEDSSWSPADEACGSTDLTDSRWHHFSAVKDGTTSITMYVDGASVGSDASLSATGSLNTASTLYIGIDSDESSYPWEGNLDEFIIYPYARSADQIKSDYEIRSNLTMREVKQEWSLVKTWKIG